VWRGIDQRDFRRHLVIGTQRTGGPMVEALVDPRRSDSHCSRAFNIYNDNERK
jgi:hypothetical protein